LLPYQAHEAEGHDEERKLDKEVKAPVLGFEIFFGLIAGDAQLDHQPRNQAKTEEKSCQQHTAMVAHMGRDYDRDQKTSNYLQALAEAGMVWIYTAAIAFCRTAAAATSPITLPNWKHIFAAFPISVKCLSGWWGHIETGVEA
jgi:hypothetical protein